LPANPAAATPELWGTMLKSFGMLLLVLGVVIVVLWLIRRYLTHQGSLGQPGLIRTLASMHVAPKERIALIDVLGKKILVGITPQQISFLARITDEDDQCGAQPTAPDGFFKSLLKKKMNGGSLTSRKKEPNHPTG